MRIVAISDLHGHLPAEVPPADLLILAGDICPDVPGSAVPGQRQDAGLRQALWLSDAFAPWLARLNVGRVVLCWGNHDYAGELPERELPPLGVEIVTDREIDIDGLRLYATPWTFAVPDVWAFDIPPARLEPYMQAIPDGIDILVTHGPPRNVLDRLASGERVGSQALAEAVARVRPKLHVFGHIHESRGQQGSSYNVAFVDEQYRPNRLPLVEIELNYISPS